MTNGKRRARWLLNSIILTPALLAGCTGTIFIRPSSGPTTLPWPPESEAIRKSVRVSAVEFRMGGGAPVRTWPEHRKAVEGLLVESRLFSEVLDSSSSEEADLHVTVRSDYDASSRWYGILLGIISGTILPVPGDYQHSVHLYVADAGDALLGHVTTSEHGTTLTSIFFLPTALMRTELMDIDKDLIRAAIAEAHAKGFF